MKKIIAILLFACALITCCSAFAEETVAGPTTILFREIEWGSSLPEVLSKLPDEIKFGSLDSDSSYHVEGTMTDDGNAYFDGHVVGYTYARSSSLKGIKVAGYELTGLKLRFAWVPGEDGLIVEDDKNTALFFAEYEIEPKDLDAVYADLTTKLSSIYGEPDSTKTSGSIIDYQYTIWNGENGTMLVLVSEAYSSGSKNIYIRYGTTEGNTWLQNAYNALILQETIEAASNIDGL